jgi:Tfp pilus assembly protein PilF
MPYFLVSALFILLSGACLFAQPQVAFVQALERFKAQQYQAALDPASRALAGDPDNPAVVHLYASVIAAVGRLEDAEKFFRKAASLAPQEAAYSYDLGALLHQERRYVEAVPILQHAVELAPENLPARMMLARSYVFSYNVLKIPNFVDLTTEQLNYILKKDPRFPAAHHHLALVYINTGELPKAVDELNAELKNFPGNAQARLELGETFLKLNENRKALEQLAIVARQAPDVPPVFYALAKAYKSEGQATKAIEAARRCVELAPDSANCHYILGQLYRSSNQQELAKQEFAAFQRLKGSGGEGGQDRP